VVGSHDVATGSIPRVRPEWSRADYVGQSFVRWGIGRYDYLVEPGLYALGTPDRSSPVLVTANYKLSFDTLRRELQGLDLFVLVLETMGINVWCAAGKGTFGTDELCSRIQKVRLEQVVDHRRLILPQLGAPGVAAHRVKEKTGFRVKYGPVEARDLPLFLADGRVTEAMRRKLFPWHERLDLVPMELVPALKHALPLAVVMVLIAASAAPEGYFVVGLMTQGLAVMVAIVAGLVCGTFLTPLLLPWIPGRAFATKGALVALLLGLPATLSASWALGGEGALFLSGLPLSLLAMALSSFWAMNFTGSSTYTSLSGVEREMRRAVPLQAIAAAVGLLWWALALVLTA
jgi:acetyl-CoA decarbonylase/synthase complex subunit gamma